MQRITAVLAIVAAIAVGGLGCAKKDKDAAGKSSVSKPAPKNAAETRPTPRPERPTIPSATTDDEGSPVGNSPEPDDEFEDGEDGDDEDPADDEDDPE